MTLLFFSRLFLYLASMVLPVLHPAITVPYDRWGWWIWFVLIPGEALIAYFFSRPRFRLRTQLICAGALLVVGMALVIGSGVSILPALVGGSAAFLSTVIVFKAKGRGRLLAVGELFFLGYHYYRLIGFSRASEAIARESSSITQVLLILFLVSFLTHALIIYLATYREGARKGNAKELVVFFSTIALAGGLLAVFMPPDFVRHSVVFNRLSEPLNPDLIPLDEYEDGSPGGNLRSREGQEQEGDEQDGSGEQGGEEGQGQGANRLEGLPSGQWQDRRSGQGQGDGEGEDKQYAVMIVASDIDPVYAADAYFEVFDAERGFGIDRENRFNELTYIRLLETWTNEEPSFDPRRREWEISFLSTIPDRVLAYEPITVRPTVLDRKYHPFDYSYTGLSAISMSRVRDWRGINGLNENEKRELNRFLEIPLREEHRLIFAAHLEELLRGRSGYFESIDAILQGFDTFQYEIGFDDSISVERMSEFLTSDRTGDCTEFSNSTAILARMAGIPSRVVTGYLASQDLQTGAHRRGIQALMEVVEPLRAFPPDQLYLVTTSHRHSWVQLFMPGFGWVDFEATAFAIPPTGDMDPNAMNVVIPIIEEMPNPLPDFKFPWLMLVRVLFILSMAGLVSAYVFRYGREMALRRASRASDPRALRALYRSLLMGLATEGHPVKSPSQTALEFADRHGETLPGIRDFAEKLTSLQYRDQFQSREKESAWDRIRQSYREALEECRQKGVKAWLRRVFSLRSLYY